MLMTYLYNILMLRKDDKLFLISSKDIQIYQRIFIDILNQK